MPQPEAYGAQPPLELLRSFLDSGGLHESSKLQWKEVYDVNLLSACAPPSGGRHMISPRLLRNLRCGFVSSHVVCFDSDWIRGVGTYI